MKINQAKYFIIVAWILLSILSGCKKEAVKVLNDYLPLTVGAKYKYNYSARYGYSPENTIKTGECTWNFISKSAGTPEVYQVEQSFTGDSVYYQDYGSGPVQKDSTHFENQISALSFEVQEDGNVVFTFPVPYWNSGNVTLERFVLSDKIDTCFILNTRDVRCLRKNVGLTNLIYYSCGNHCSDVSYTLIEGPTY